MDEPSWRGCSDKNGDARGERWARVRGEIELAISTAGGGEVPHLRPVAMLGPWPKRAALPRVAQIGEAGSGRSPPGRLAGLLTSHDRSTPDQRPPHESTPADRAGGGVGPRRRGALRPLRRGGPAESERLVLVDFRGLQFIASVGLHACAGPAVASRSAALDVVFVRADPGVQRAFDVVGLGQRLAFVDAVDEARACYH